MLKMEQIDIKISHGDTFLDRMMPIILKSIDYMKKRPRRNPPLPCTDEACNLQQSDSGLVDSGMCIDAMDSYPKTIIYCVSFMVISSLDIKSSIHLTLSL